MDCPVANNQLIGSVGEGTAGWHVIRWPQKPLAEAEAMGHRRLMSQDSKWNL